MSDKLDATISISADTSGVEAGIDKTKRSLKNLGASAQGMAGELARAGREGGAGLDAIGKGGDRAAKQVEQAERSMRNSIQRQIAQMQAGSKTSREYWESLANQRGVNTAGLRSMLDQLEAVQRAQKKATESADGWGASLRGAGAAAAGLLGALSLSEFVGKLVSVQREFDVLNASLVTVTGSAQAAATEFSWIKDFAKETPFGLKQATEAFVKMKSLGLDPTKASLTSFGNTASAMGKSLDQMIEAVADASTSEFERLKEFGIKASQSGETVAMTFQGVTKNIGNNAQEIVAYLESIGNHEFAGAMAERAKTLDGAIAELGDKWDEVFRTINENNTGSFIHDSVKLATGAIEDLNTIMRSLNEATSEGAQATGAFKTMQEGLAIVFETVAVVGLTVKDTLVGVGREIGAIAAQAAALARLDFKGFAAIGDMAKEDAQKARAEWEQAVDAILTARQRVATGPALTNPKDEGTNKKTVVDLNSVATAALNATKSFQSQAEKMAEVREQGDKLRGALRQLEQAGQGESKEAAQLRERLKGVDERLESMAKSGGDGAKGIKATDNSIKSLLKSLEAKTAAQRLEIAQGDKLTESQRDRIQLEALLADSKNKASKRQVANAQALLAESEANEAWLKNASDVEKALADMQKAREQSLQSVQDSVKNLAEEAEAYEYAESNHVSLAQAKAHLAERQALVNYQMAIERQEAPETLRYYEEQLRITREIAQATDKKEVREGNKKAAEDAKKEWERVSQTIGDTLADYIMGGGKDAAQYLKRLFSTLVLQPVVNYGVNTAMGALGMGQAGTAAGSVLGGNNVGTTILNNAGLIGAGFQAMYGMSVGASSASLAAANAVGMVGGDALGTLIAGNGAWAGVAVEAGTAAGAAAGSSAAGSFASTLAAAAPWLMAGAALLAVVPSLLNGGTPHAGAASMYSGGMLSGTGSAYTSRVSVTDTYNAAIQKPVDALAVSIGSALDGLAKQFSQATGYSVGTGFKSDNDDPSAGRFIVTGPQGEILRQWEAYQRGELGARATGERYDKDPAKGFDQYLQSVTAATIPIVQGIVPGWADNLLNQLSESLGIAGALASGEKNPWKQMSVSGQEAFDALQQVLAQIAATDAAFDALGKTMSMFSGLTEDMKTSLLGAAGSIENLTSIASGYYGSSMYTEGERMLSARQQQMDALASMGLYIDPAEGERAKALFRKTVEEAMATGQGELAVQLMAMSASFAQTADYATKLFSDVEESAREAAEAAQEAALAAAQAAAEAARAAAQAVGNAWSNLGTASGWAAQYLGDSSGLQAQLGIVQSSYKGATTVQGREAALEQIIALEQSLWQVEDRNRQAAAQAAQQQAQALQSQLSAVNALISASQSLGKYAESIFNGADSGLSDFERLDMLAAQYSSQLVLAKGGDAEAMGNLQGTTGAYLQLAQQLSGSQADYSVLSGQIAAELAATAAISGASAKTQADTLQAQIDAALAQAQYASRQFEVSAATKELIAKQLADSAKQFDAEMKLLRDQLQSGLDANLLLAEMPAELTGVLNDTLVPVIGRISDAAMSAASMSAASAEAARKAAAAASAAASSAAAAAIANARIDGSHAGGLSYVPFDGYTAELHKGERVLTAAENRMFSMPVIQVQSQNSSNELQKKVERLEAQMARMADATERLLDITDRVTADGNANATEIMNVRELAKAIAEEMA